MVDAVAETLEQAVDQARVEVDALLVQRALAARHDPGPGDREAIDADAEIGHQVEILLPVVVVIAADVTGLAACRSAGLVAVGVPDRLPAAALVHRALDLVGRGRNSPSEIGRKTRNQSTTGLCRHLL